MKRVVMVVLLLVIALAAQTIPSQMTLSPVAPSTGCVSSGAGDVLCAASDGFYVSITGGPFQKINVGAVTLPTTINCSTASLSTGTTGTLTASGCTFK